MNASEAINKIREMLGLEFNKTEEAVNETFATTYLEDGTTQITNNREADFELGDEVFVILEDGTLSPAPSGSHTTREGWEIVLDEESRVVEIKDANVEEEPVEEVVTEETVVEEQQAEQINFEEELKAIKSSLDKMLSLMEAQSDSFTKEVEGIKADVEAFKSAPERQGINEPKKVKENFAEYRANLLRKYTK